MHNGMSVLKATFSPCQNDVLKYIYIMQATADVEGLISSTKAEKMLSDINAIYVYYQKKGGQPFEQ